MPQIIEYQGDSTIAVDGVFIELLNEAFWSPGDWYVEVTVQRSPYPHPQLEEDGTCPECGGRGDGAACPSHPDFPNAEGMSWGELADVEGVREAVEIKGRLIEFERSERRPRWLGGAPAPSDSGSWVTIHPYDIDAEKYTGDPVRIDTETITKLVIP